MTRNIINFSYTRLYVVKNKWLEKYNILLGTNYNSKNNAVKIIG